MGKLRHLVQYLSTRYEYTLGSAALGIDFPGLEVDLKVKSIRQPQSSCPLKYNKVSQTAREFMARLKYPAPVK